MKKTILSLLIIVAAISSLNAQVYTLSVDGEPLGDTVTVYGDPEAAGMEFEAVFTNNTDNNANIKVRRNQVLMLEDATSYFKWNQTYSPLIDMSEAYLVGAGESLPSDFFKAYYQPKGNIGISIIEYTFFNVSVENEFVTLVIKFNTTSDDIDENIIRNMTVSNAYPNPASDILNLDFDFPVEVESASVRIVNVLGSVVAQQDINTMDNKIGLDISNLNDGIYFYSLFINDEVYRTEKIIIK